MTACGSKCLLWCNVKRVRCVVGCVVEGKVPCLFDSIMSYKLLYACDVYSHVLGHDWVWKYT